MFIVILSLYHIHCVSSRGSHKSRHLDTNCRANTSVYSTSCNITTSCNIATSCNITTSCNTSVFATNLDHGGCSVDSKSNDSRRLLCSVCVCVSVCVGVCVHVCIVIICRQRNTDIRVIAFECVFISVGNSVGKLDGEGKLMLYIIDQ